MPQQPAATASPNAWISSFDSSSSATPFPGFDHLQTPFKPVQPLSSSSSSSVALTPGAPLLDSPIKPPFPISPIKQSALASSSSSSSSHPSSMSAPPIPSSSMSDNFHSDALQPNTPANNHLTSAQIKAMSHAQANAALQNPGTAIPTVYLATYSNVPVYEITVRGIAVMRRRGDGWLNATQILKIAGIEKTKRTKILEKSILTGEHEKIQGGYGKFQGTWIPLERAQILAVEHNVSHLLKPILEFDPSTADQIPKLYQRRKPASARNSTAGASANESRAASVASNNKLYSPAPSVTPAPSQQPRFLALRPPKPGQVDRQAPPALFMPPGGGGLLYAFASDASSPSDLPAAAIPPGSTQAQQDALRGYAIYGYTPQGIPLPDPRLLPLASVAGEKRSGPSDPDDRDTAVNAKRQRMDSPQRTFTTNAIMLLGPSPVKDLNALGPSGGSLRAASAPRANRIAVGSPDAAARDGAVPRYADRALPPKPYDEGEKRMRDHLVGLFVEEESSLRPKPSPLKNGTPKFPASVPTAASGGDASKEAANAELETEQDQAKLDQLLVQLKDKASLGGVGGNGSDGPKASVDLVTDDHGHTALHWASALCRLSLVRTLVSRPPWEGGANLHAGNHAGETALHRSVLVTNSYDTSSFPALLHLLASSLNTRDFKKRTVLHHVALVAALKGRAASARYYLACVLEHLANEKSAKYKSLIDAQDEDGETALGIVARLGNASMIRMLIDMGARKDLPNALGIRPSDWGIDAGETAASSHDPSTSSSSSLLALPPATAAELASHTPHDIVSALTRPTQPPVMKSKDVRDQLTSTLDELQTSFDKELKEKQDSLGTVQSHLQAATRELANRRKDVSLAQAQVAEKDEARQRVRNLKKALSEHLEVFVQDPAFETHVESLLKFSFSSLSGRVVKEEAMEVDGEEHSVSKTDEEEIEQLIPLSMLEADLEQEGVAISETVVQVEKLVRLRWLVERYEKACTQLQANISVLEGASARKEMQCQQVVAMCANIPQDKVESMLDDLMTAMESDGQDVDLARVANFMQKVGKSNAVATTPSLTNTATLPLGSTVEFSAPLTTMNETALQ